MEGTVEALQNEHVGDEDRKEEDAETISVLLSLARSINTVTRWNPTASLGTNNRNEMGLNPGTSNPVGFP